MKDALDDLIAKVEAGDINIPDCEAVFGSSGRLRLHTLEAFEGSIDAAFALHKSILPGWTVRLTATLGEDKSFPYVHIFKMRTTPDDPSMGTNSSGYRGFYPARAWLLAILRAMRETA